MLTHVYVTVVLSWTTWGCLATRLTACNCSTTHIDTAIEKLVASIVLDIANDVSPIELSSPTLTGTTVVNLHTPFGEALSGANSGARRLPDSAGYNIRCRYDIRCRYKIRCDVSQYCLQLEASIAHALLQYQDNTRSNLLRDASRYDVYCESSITHDLHVHGDTYNRGNHRADIPTTFLLQNTENTSI